MDIDKKKNKVKHKSTVRFLSQMLHLGRYVALCYG